MYRWYPDGPQWSLPEDGIAEQKYDDNQEEGAVPQIPKPRRQVWINKPHNDTTDLNAKQPESKAVRRDRVSQNDPARYIVTGVLARHFYWHTPEDPGNEGTRDTTSYK